MSHRHLLIAILSMTASCARTAPPTLEVHPAVFEMVECWLSDSVSPVVTEVNLDAVAANQNQFNSQDVQRIHGFIQAPGPDGRGFQRYQILSSDGGVYKIEYQSNGGGSLTTRARIEIEVTQRALRIDGTSKCVRVMRVLSYRCITHYEPSAGDQASRLR